MNCQDHDPITDHTLIQSATPDFTHNESCTAAPTLLKSRRSTANSTALSWDQTRQAAWLFLKAQRAAVHESGEEKYCHG
jgi:hypothetical protein